MSDHESNGSYGLVVPFETDDPSFARGVEIGRLWEMLKAEPHRQITEIIHLSNAEMALRVGEALERRVVADPSDEVWMTVTYAAEGYEI